MKQYVLSLSALALVGATACTPAAAPQVMPVPEARLSYAPAYSCATPGSVPVTIAVVSPQFKDVTRDIVSQQGATNQLVFNTMPGAMRADFMETLSCRGFATKGPFASYDEMMFPDRSGSDLILAPEITLDVTLSNLETVSADNALMSVLSIASSTAPTRMTINGTVRVGGRVSLRVNESITNTGMANPSVELEPTVLQFTGETAYETVRLAQSRDPEGTMRQLAFNDPGLRRVLIPVLEKYYVDVLRTADGHLDPEGMKLTKQQSLEVRRNANSSIVK